MITKNKEAKKEYLDLVKFALSQDRKKDDGEYYEAHHILPKSIYPLWKNRKNNLVLFTPREHFRAHQLLAKIFDNREMWCAIHLMSNANGLEINENEYEEIKNHWIKSQIKYTTEEEKIKAEKEWQKKADLKRMNNIKRVNDIKKYHKKYNSSEKGLRQGKVNAWARRKNYPDPLVAEFPKKWNDDDKKEYLRQYSKREEEK